MQAQAQQPITAPSQAATLYRSAPLMEASAIVLLVGFCAAFFAYLLARFPYDGLYGQDSYAYFYQARALLHELQGIPAQPGELFGTEGLYHWPIGYHLHLALGLLFAPGPGGGRAITLGMAVGATALLYLLVGRLWPGAALRSRVIAGMAAGLALPLVATYTRMGLSIMADVPALFWSLLSVYCLLRAWPVAAKREGRHRAAWAVAAGAALGLAVLVRYGAGLLMAPIGAYLLLRWWLGRGRGQAWGPSLLWLAPGFILALSPQAMYALTHHTAGAGYGDWLSAWNPANIFSSNVVSADGASSYAQPMWVFYLLQPFYSTDQGFLSALYLPAILLGLFVLVRQRSIPVVGMLAVWWLGPALFLSGTPYQSQRFVLGYLPALLALLGIGVATAVEWVATALRGASVPYRWGLAVVAILVLLGTATGAYQEQNATRAWAATQASFQADEQAVVALAGKAAGDASKQPPRILSFGATAALYHYTGWPVLEFYNADEQAIATFWQAPGPRVLVIPEASMATQWANTPMSARWRWLQQHYTLKLQGTANVYTVYSVEGTR